MTPDRHIRRLIEKRDRAQERLNAANDIEITCPNCAAMVTVQDVTECGACQRFICENCTVFVEVMDCCSPCAVEIAAEAKVPISEKEELICGTSGKVCTATLTNPCVCETEQLGAFAPDKAAAR